MFHSDDLEEMKAEFTANQRNLRVYMAELMRAPDCRDPDHPGCRVCDDERDEDE